MIIMKVWCIKLKKDLKYEDLNVKWSNKIEVKLYEKGVNL